MSKTYNSDHDSVEEEDYIQEPEIMISVETPVKSQSAITKPAILIADEIIVENSVLTH